MVLNSKPSSSATASPKKTSSSMTSIIPGPPTRSSSRTWSSAPASPLLSEFCVLGMMFRATKTSSPSRFAMSRNAAARATSKSFFAPAIPGKSTRKRRSAPENRNPPALETVPCLHKCRHPSVQQQKSGIEVEAMKRLLAFLALTFFACVAGATRLAAQNLAITNVRIIVGNGDVIENGSIVARDGKLVSVAAGAPNAPGVQVIDAHGMTAVPGFIDAHHHLMGRNPDQYLKTEAVQDMQSFLDAGYTTVLAGLGPVPGILQL